MAALQSITAALIPRSFGARLALSVALLVAVLAVSLSVLQGALIARVSQAGEGAALSTVANNAARLLGDGLALRDREVRALAASPTLWRQGLDSENVRQVLHRTQAVNPYNAWIGVTDAAGTVRAATGNLLVGADVSQRPWFQAGKVAPHVGDVHLAKLLARFLPPGKDGGPQRFVDFAAPILSQGRLIGVLGVHGSWEWTHATIESLLPADAARRGLEVLVFDRHGQPIYARGTTLKSFQSSGQTLPLRAAPGTGSAAAPAQARVIAWADGRDYLSTAAALPLLEGADNLGWTIVAREPVEIAYAVAREGAALALAAGLLAALLASTLGAWMASRLTEPLRRMSSAALAVEHGATQLPLQAGSLEIEQLSGALHAMTGSLMQAHAELEQRVADRTAQLAQANNELAQLARHDPLTGLLNRRGLDERWREVLSSARRRRSPVALLLLDADHFKRINDSFGHAVGDAVLRELSHTLRQRLREVDLLARIGGEEFVAVLQDTDAAQACMVAGNLRELVAARAMPQAGRVTVSIGIAAVTAATGDSLAEALQRADAALYRAKDGGRNRVELAPDAAPLEAAEPALESAA